MVLLSFYLSYVVSWYVQITLWTVAICTLDCGHLHFGLCATVGTAIVQLMVYVACSMNFQLQIFLSLECVYTPGR